MLRDLMCSKAGSAQECATQGGIFAQPIAGGKERELAFNASKNIKLLCRSILSNKEEGCERES